MTNSNFKVIMDGVNKRGEKFIDELSYNAFYLLDMTQNQLNKLAEAMINKGYKNVGKTVYFKNGITITIKK